MSTVSFVNVNKIYDNNVQAVFDFNLEVADKEFIVLVGPSGCGKSTTLRMLAGLEEISSGTIAIDGEIINDVLPKNRNIAMVFQNYALYPHMTVYDNMAFALKIKHVDSATIDERVLQTAKILDLTPYLKRKPKALSGGQRQRVALGRAIVRTPKVFLMDEPLSNLDAKLRVQMRSEISKIHQKVGATTVYVTHDQTEAMTMADRIVIMKDGYIQQIGTPKEVYSLPHNMFVGGFIGSPAMNFIEGTFNGKEFVVTNKENAEEGTKVKVPENFVKLLDKYRSQKIEELKAVIEEEKNAEANENAAPEQKLSKKNVAIRDENISRRKASIEKHETLLAQLESGTYPVVFGVRPEDVKIVSGKTAPITTLKCDISELLGRDSIVYTYIDGQRLIVQTEADNEVSEGQSFGIDFNFKKCHFFDVESTVRIRE